MLILSKHFIAKILFIFYITGSINCKQTPINQNTSNSDVVELEIKNEIEMFRKQLFVDFLYRHENFKKIIQDDGTFYDN